MLKYLILITEELIVVGLLTGLLASFITAVYGKKGRNTLLAGAGLALVLSVIMAVLKNTTRKIDTGMWNLRTFLFAIAACLIFLIFAHAGARKKAGKIVGGVAYGSAALLLCALLFYELPDVLAYPWNFDVADNSILSTDFIYRFIGYILGILLALVAGIAVYRCGRALPEKKTLAVLRAALIVNAVGQAATALQIMYTKRIIPSNHTLFAVLKFSSNHSDAFIYLIMLTATAAAVYLFVSNTKVREEYENPAALRKIRARMRRNRRWAAALIVCCALATLNLTAFRSLTNKEVELAPAEACAVMGDNVYVTFDQVADGHLHRFEYETADGVRVRFIVIKKPNSSAYGIGLDACDICGETGYYERDGQVVCKLCDVVMNINTIGFKGGCNPIVIEYSIADGKIIIPISTLVEHQDEFK